MGRISLMIKIRQGQGRWRVSVRFAPIKGGHRAGGAMELNRVLCTRRVEEVGSGIIVWGGGRGMEGVISGVDRKNEDMSFVVCKKLRYRRGWWGGYCG